MNNLRKFINPKSKKKFSNIFNNLKFSLLSFYLILIIMLLAGCSNDGENIQKYGEIVENETQQTEKISNGKFSVTVPELWQDKYISIVSDKDIQLYQKAAYENFGGGWLCSFTIYDDLSYTEIPSYDIISSGGVINAETGENVEEYTYIIMYPTDVQADLEDEESTAEYYKMYDEIPQVLDSFVLES